MNDDVWVTTQVLVRCAAPADAEPMTTRSGQPRRIWPEVLSVELFERTGESPTRSITVQVRGVAARADKSRGIRRGSAHVPLDLHGAPEWVRERAPAMIAEVQREGRLVKTDVVFGGPTDDLITTGT